MPASQEKVDLEGDLAENQENLGYVVRAENARMTQVTSPPVASLLVFLMRDEPL